MSEAGGVLARSVTLRDPDTFRLVTFSAGEAPPAWAAKLITNPSAWGSDSAPTSEGESSSLPAGNTDPGQGTTETGGGSETDAQGGEDLIGDVPPPKNGAGSGRDAWVAYANSKNVAFADDASRADIIAAVEAAAK